MRIGFATIYSWRPHVEHLYFLATLARKAGHDTYFLTCDGNLPTCYTRELRGRAAWWECTACRIGGIRSYAARRVTSIGECARTGGMPAIVPREWAYSSASTLGRFESDADYASASFAELAERLYPAVRIAYQSALAWIERNRLEAICVFNGRMDVTRAIFEAAKSMGVRVVTLERTWFGDGLQLLPEENCLGLKSVDSLVATWKDVPLTREQAIKAAALVAARFLRVNLREWRAYNRDARSIEWPAPDAKRRILLIPSSRSEVWGHPDWTPHWADPTLAYDALIARLGLQAHDLVLRCHPNWGEKIGRRDGRFSERHYVEWARARGVKYIPSRDKASTLNLIEQCDAIVVANGSAALEAGLLGKQVIGIAPSAYQSAGIRDSACTPAELDSLLLHVDLDATERGERAQLLARRTLRFCYTISRRVAQYTRHVKAETTTRFRYDFDASPDRFIDLLRTGKLQADDDEFAEDCDGENEVLELIRTRDWAALHSAVTPSEVPALGSLRRRLLYRPVDLISRVKPLGDR